MFFVNEGYGMRCARVCAGWERWHHAAWLVHAYKLARPGQYGHRAPSFHGEQEALAGRLFTASFIFGVDYIHLDYYGSSLHVR